MNKHVALIRGINVGSAKRVGMADLRRLVTDLGYDDVRTLLNSGNIVFTAATTGSRDAAQRIQEGIAARLGVSARVIVLAADEFNRVVAENSLRSLAQEASRFLVTFVSNPSDLAKIKHLMQQDWTPETLAIGQRAAYLWCPNGILASKLPDAVGRLLGDAATTRNWATVMKLQALLRDHS